MKFIHVSDIHIGASPDPTKYYTNDRTMDIFETFTNVIKKCKEVNADLLLISGDLFNHQPVTKELNDVNSLFSSIPNTSIVIVAGSYDCIKSNSPILNYKFSDNVYYFFNQFPEDKIINNKFVVTGFSYFRQEENNNFIDSINIKDDDLTHILLAYAGDSRHCPIDYNILEKKRFSYCALGSNHNYQEVIANKAYYSGSLEPLSDNETGDHGIILGEINDVTHRLEYTIFLKFSKSTYIPIEIKITPDTTQDDLVENVTHEIIKNGSNNIYIIKLTGLRDPDVEFTPELLNKKIKISTFIDNTEPRYDFIKLSAEHPQDMIGAYIRKLTNTNVALSEIDKKALYYGVHALIKSSEKFE